MSSSERTELRDFCPTVYGPVRSRRHGFSLGINLGDAEKKACTWSCVYCQCGFGHRVGEISGLRIPARHEVLKGVREALKAHPDLDSVTMAGNTEPTSHPEFAEIVQDVLDLRRQTAGKWTFNVLSNGSELDPGNTALIAACDSLDEVWIKLDCAEEDLFRRLNRPIARIGGIHQHLVRIRLLQAPRIQTLLWGAEERPNLASWTEGNRKALLAAYKQVAPVQIFITTIQREPAMSGLLPVPATELEEFGEQVRAAGFNVKIFADDTRHF